MEAKGGRVTQPEFLTELYDLVDDVERRESKDGFIMNDPEEFFKSLPPEYFKGFRKTFRDSLEYPNYGGLRGGQRHLLSTIKRRTPAATRVRQQLPPVLQPSVEACTEARKTEIDSETSLDSLLQKIIDAGKHAQLLQKKLSPKAAANEQSGCSSQVSGADKKRKLLDQNEKSSSPDKKAERSDNVHFGCSSGAKLAEYSPDIAALIKGCLISENTHPPPEYSPDNIVALIKRCFIGDNTRPPPVHVRGGLSSKISGEALPEAIQSSSRSAHNALFTKAGIRGSVQRKNIDFHGCHEPDDIRRTQDSDLRKLLMEHLLGKDSDDKN